NTAALQHAREAAKLMIQADKSFAEMAAACTALRLQTAALAQRVADLEAVLPLKKTLTRTGKPRSSHDRTEQFQAYAGFFRTQEQILVLGSERGELLKGLVAEGIPVLGVEATKILVDYCTERELPAVHARAMDYLQELPDGSGGGIVVNLHAGGV